MTELKGASSSSSPEETTDAKPVIKEICQYLITRTSEKRDCRVTQEQFRGPLKDAKCSVELFNQCAQLAARRMMLNVGGHYAPDQWAGSGGQEG